MAASFLRDGSSSQTMLPLRSWLRQIPLNSSGLVVVTLISFGVVFAPDQPEHQANICQRHNPIEACLVF